MEKSREEKFWEYLNGTQSTARKLTDSTQQSSDRAAKFWNYLDRNRDSGSPQYVTTGRNPGGSSMLPERTGSSYPASLRAESKYAPASDREKRYDSVMQGVSTYDKQRIGSFTRDTGGGYSRYLDYLSGQDVRRTASLKDLTWNSLKRGYYNSLYGEESFKAMNNEPSQKEAYKKILTGEDYQFIPRNDFAGAVSGAMELIGQQARQYTHPRTVAAVGAAGIGALALGQAGPQVLAPEEFITVPGAMAAAFKAGSAVSNLEIEAGHAYNEMLEIGISEKTARKVAWGVGSVNAGLDLLQTDELLDAYKATRASGATKTVTQRIADELLDRGIDIAKETAQEVMQEGVTIAGVQAASKRDTGDYVYDFNEVKGRLKDTAKSSMLSFGLMNVPAAAKNTASVAVKYRRENAADNVRNGTPSEVAKDFPVTMAAEQKNAAPKGDIQYSVRDGSLTTESTEEERYEILKNTEITLAEVDMGAIGDVDLEAFNTRKKSAVVPGLKALANKLGILNVDLANSKIAFPFKFSARNLAKSAHHQLEYGGTYQDCVKALSCFEKLVKNAVPIEVHGEKKKGTVKENPDLKQTYVLISAYREGRRIVPVQLEVKEFFNYDNSLYMMVTLTKIDSEVVEKKLAAKSGSMSPLFPKSTVMISDILRNVNPRDGRFLKYVPDGFLSAVQKAAKQEALRKQNAEYAGYGAKMNAGTNIRRDNGLNNSRREGYGPSAYLKKNNGDVTQAPAEGLSASHETNARSALASPSPENSIYDATGNVNGNTAFFPGDDELLHRYGQLLQQEELAYGRYEKELERYFRMGDGVRDRFDQLKESAIDNEQNFGIIKTRGLAMSLRKSKFHVLTDEEIRSIRNDAMVLEIDETVLRFNEGQQTGFNDTDECINIRGDILPDPGGITARDRMTQRAVLAHEYYGHLKNHPSEYPVGDWRDEFRASYDAAVKAPNLTDEERRDLMIDAYDRAKEAGAFDGYDETARRIVYGF